MGGGRGIDFVLDAYEAALAAHPRADLCVFDGDIPSGDPEEILSAGVDATILAGEFVYRRP